MKYFQPTDVNRIMIRMTNWIGDAVMTTPALRAIRENYPEAEITVVATPLVAQLFEFHSDCDRVIIYDRDHAHHGMIGFLRFSQRLKQERFDLAILFQNAISAALMAFFAAIPQRLGYTREYRGVFLTMPVPVSPQLATTHHTDYYLKLVETLGIAVTDNAQHLLIRDEELNWASAMMPTGPTAVVNPGAAYGSAKRWLPERFAAVADQLVDDYGLSIILTGGPAEVEIGQDIALAMKSPCQNFIGQTSVRELMALLQKSQLIITNDSGPMHIGAALKTPLVAIFGPTDHTTTSPWSDNSMVVRHSVDCAPCLLRQCPTDHRCMEAVAVADVMSAVNSLLGDPS